eukprot:gene6301-biopygen2863
MTAPQARKMEKKQRRRRCQEREHANPPRSWGPKNAIRRRGHRGKCGKTSARGVGGIVKSAPEGARNLKSGAEGAGDFFELLFAGAQAQACPGVSTGTTTFWRPGKGCPLGLLLFLGARTRPGLPPAPRKPNLRPAKPGQRPRNRAPWDSGDSGVRRAPPRLQGSGEGRRPGGGTVGLGGGSKGKSSRCPRDGPRAVSAPAGGREVHSRRRNSGFFLSLTRRRECIHNWTPAAVGSLGRRWTGRAQEWRGWGGGEAFHFFNPKSEQAPWQTNTRPQQFFEEEWSLIKLNDIYGMMGNHVISTTVSGHFVLHS